MTVRPETLAATRRPRLAAALAVLCIGFGAATQATAEEWRHHGHGGAGEHRFWHHDSWREHRWDGWRPAWRSAWIRHEVCERAPWRCGPPLAVYRGPGW